MNTREFLKSTAILGITIGTIGNAWELLKIGQKTETWRRLAEISAKTGLSFKEVNLIFQFRKKHADTFHFKDNSKQEHVLKRTEGECWNLCFIRNYYSQDISVEDYKLILFYGLLNGQEYKKFYEKIYL